MFFSEIESLGENGVNSCLWAPIVMQISTNPNKCGIIL